MCLYIDEQWHRVEEKLVYGVESNSTLLECVPRSLQAKVLWFVQKGGEKHEVRCTHAYCIKTADTAVYSNIIALTYS